MWLVAIAASLFFTFVAASGMYTDQPGFFWLNFATAVAVVSVIVVMAIRFGLLAAAVTFLVTNWTTNIPWTTATDRWDFPLSALAFGIARRCGRVRRLGGAHCRCPWPQRR